MGDTTSRIKISGWWEIHEKKTRGEQENKTPKGERSLLKIRKSLRTVQKRMSRDRKRPAWERKRKTKSKRANV